MGRRCAPHYRSRADAIEMTTKDNFKICSNCGFEWKSREDFLNDHSVIIIGYQTNFKSLEAGIFLFNHSCKGTFGLEVSDFANLYDGPVFQERATGSDECPEYCLHKYTLDSCPAKCECAFVREIIQLLKK